MAEVDLLVHLLLRGSLGEPMVRGAGLIFMDERTVTIATNALGRSILNLDFAGHRL